MLDLETFGFRKHAAICQIGACYFDEKFGTIGKTLKLNIDARTSVAEGAVIDADTVYWWLSQSSEAINSIVQGPSVSIRDGLAQLNDFLEPALNIWSHATFDFVITTEAMARLGIAPKFSFRASRDLRTLVALAGYSPKKQPRSGTHHDALDDCKYQVQYAVEALRKLKK